MEAITRDFFLFLSKNNLLNNIAKKSGGSFAAGKIIGELISKVPLNSLNSLIIVACRLQSTILGNSLILRK